VFLKCVLPLAKRIRGRLRGGTYLIPLECALLLKRTEHLLQIFNVGVGLRMTTGLLSLTNRRPEVGFHVRGTLEEQRTLLLPYQLMYTNSFEFSMTSARSVRAPIAARFSDAVLALKPVPSRE